MTKQELFAVPSQEDVVDDKIKTTKTGGISQIDSIESQNNEAIKVVGSFDELNGVLTPD